ncbi:glycoside hydrolase family 30 protein [Planctomycetota bacterium]|nr:glycoside hydrolase family 30 protein [Planctomycetota bacterium]
MTQVSLEIEDHLKEKQVEVYLTAKDTDDRLAKDKVGYGRVLEGFEGEGEIIPVVVKKNITYQTIEGFGGAFTEAGAYTMSRLPQELQDEMIEAYFDAEKGNKYRLCRTHINSCDFALGNYAYVEDEKDLNFETFSLERDHQYLIPMIRRAIDVCGDELKIFASPWSPPAWMKTTGKMNQGGQLKEEHRDTWARYIAKYVHEYAKVDIPLWGLSVQNEPAAVQTWDSCRYSAKEERDFVRDHLGPVFEKEGLDYLKLIVWDHNRDYLFDRASVILDDPEAAKYVWGVGFHWYCNGNFENLDMTMDAYPDVRLIFTEGCQEGGPHIGEWCVGERYGFNIIKDLNHYTAAWTDWNMLLDKQGGPNHVGNFCSAPIIADVKKGKLLYQSSFYYIGHFSRFIDVGAKRILCSTCHKDVLATAAVNPNGDTIIVVMNQTDDMQSVRVRGVSDEVFDYQMPRHSIVSFVVKA